MKAWMYKSIVLTHNRFKNTEEDMSFELDHFLNKYGKEGWRLVSVNLVSMEPDSMEQLYTFIRENGEVEE